MQGLSVYLLTALIAWIAAQGGKYIIQTIRGRGLNNYRQLYMSGGMPSAHSATTVSMVVMIGLTDGVGNGLFALSALLAAIVMYDAMMVRHASGTQGAAIHALIEEQHSKVPLPRVARGHTPFEVAAGALLGLTVALVVFLATQ